VDECAGVKWPKAFESDFSAILQRSHSLDKEQIERMSTNFVKAPKFKIINDRLEENNLMFPPKF